MKIQPAFALSILVATLVAVPAGTADAQLPRFRGVLTTEFRGPNMCLDVVNGGGDNNQAELRPCADVSGQKWTLARQSGGAFTFTNDFRGPRSCLDWVTAGPRIGQVELRPCDPNSGSQLWLPQQGPGEFNRFSSVFDLNLCMDVVSSGPRENRIEVRPCADVSGQHWKLTPL